MLAQANLIGGGDIDAESIPASPLPPMQKAERTELAEPVAPQEIEPVAEPVLPEPASPPEQETVEQLAVEVEKAASAAEETPDAVQTKRPSASELMTNSLKMAALSSEVQRKLETRAKRPKKDLHISQHPSI